MNGKQYIEPCCGGLMCTFKYRVPGTVNFYQLRNKTTTDFFYQLKNKTTTDINSIFLLDLYSSKVSGK